MSSFFIDKTDPHIAEILERLRRVNKILQKTETLVQPTLNNERFLTDEELSKILRVSRRTLQEYNSQKLGIMELYRFFRFAIEKMCKK